MMEDRKNGDNVWEWRMEVRTDEAQKTGVLEKKDVLDIMFQVRGGKWGFVTRLTKGYLGWPDTHKPKALTW